MLFLAIDSISLSDSLLMSLVGLCIVFFALVAIMGICKLLGTVVKALQKNKAPELTAVSAVPAARPSDGKVPAPGSLGEVALHGVAPRTAAMLMAIVADEMKTPLNELRFISIKEI